MIYSLAELQMVFGETRDSGITTFTPGLATKFARNVETSVLDALKHVETASDPDDELQYIYTIRLFELDAIKRQIAYHMATADCVKHALLGEPFNSTVDIAKLPVVNRNIIACATETYNMAKTLQEYDPTASTDLLADIAETFREAQEATFECFLKVAKVCDNAHNVAEKAVIMTMSRPDVDAQVIMKKYAPDRLNLTVGVPDYVRRKFEKAAVEGFDLKTGEPKPVVVIKGGPGRQDVTQTFEEFAYEYQNHIIRKAAQAIVDNNFADAEEIFATETGSKSPEQIKRDAQGVWA